MNIEPLVTVNILSYNRKDELLLTITKVYEQTYKNIEIVVVDNASSEATTQTIENKFPAVKLIKLKKNIGIAGWNEGFKFSNGEYILVLDDDSYPLKNTISLAVDCIKNDTKIGVVCLPVFNKRFNVYESDHISEDNPNTFIGCGALIRKNIFAKTDYFNEFLFLYEHETEFSMRVINSGYNIRYCKEADIIHENSVSNRKIKMDYDHRRKYYLSRNYLLILFMHFSIINILFFVPQLIISRLIVSIEEKSFLTTLSGFLSSIKFFPRIIKKRKPLKKSVRKFYRFGNYMGRFAREREY